MDQFDLNLSTRPFPAHRLKTALLLVAAVLVVAVSVWQGISFARYSRLSRQIRGEARAAEVDSEALNRRLDDMESTLTRPEVQAKLSEIEFLNTAIARRKFAWTRIFANLEAMKPESVHLMSLRPEFNAKGGVLLHIDVRSRTVADVTRLIEAMQASPVFGDVSVTTEEKKDPTLPAADIDITLTVPYHADKDTP